MFAHIWDRKEQNLMKTIVWCIDPNDDQIDKSQSITALQAFATGMANVQILPVYVLSPKSTQLSRFAQSSFIEKLIPWAKKQMQNYIEQLPSTDLNIQAPEVLFNPKHSLRHDVLKTIEFAEQNKADTIFCSSHSKSTWTLGSFAETLVLKSKIPILLYQPKAKIAEYFDNIMFPTDFSVSSKNALKNLIPLAKQWGSQIHIVHQILNPVDPIVESGVLTMGGGWTSPETYNQSIKEYAEDEFQHMKELCNAQNVECHSHLLEPSSFFTQDIVDFATENDIQLIAISSSADDYLSIIVGSHCRDLIRNSKIPMWIQHIENN